jgi:hypothetical protein
MGMPNCLSVSEVADRIGNGIRPRDISDLFYQRVLRNDVRIVIAGRRLIPESYVPEIVKALCNAGKLESSAVTVNA